MERSSVKSGDVILVAGPGTIGIMMVQVAKAMGATVIVSSVEKDKERLALAKKLGVDHSVQVDTKDLKKN